MVHNFRTKVQFLYLFDSATMIYAVLIESSMVSCYVARQAGLNGEIDFPHQWTVTKHPETLIRFTFMFGRFCMNDDCWTAGTFHFIFTGLELCIKRQFRIVAT